jgi:hypothetical protein
MKVESLLSARESCYVSHVQSQYKAGTGKLCIWNNTSLNPTVCLKLIILIQTTGLSLLTPDKETNSDDMYKLNQEG